MDIIQQVTKVKNPGRVAGGHKLAAWNLKNKQKLKQKPNQELKEPNQVSEQEPNQVSEQEPNQKPNQTSNFVYGLILLICGGGLAVFLSKKHVTAFLSKKPAPTESIKETPKKYME